MSIITIKRIGAEMSLFFNDNNIATFKIKGSDIDKDL